MILNRPRHFVPAPLFSKPDNILPNQTKSYRIKYIIKCSKKSKVI